MRLDNVTFSYGDKVIFRDFTLSLPNLGVTAISGPSGCGKTTLLRLIAGLERPASGTVTAPPPSDIAILFQEDRLLPGFTSSDQLRAVLRRGAPTAKKLLILDEPFTGVDPETAKKIMSTLRALSIPILYSAHDSETLSLSDTLIPLSTH